MQVTSFAAEPITANDTVQIATYCADTQITNISDTTMLSQDEYEANLQELELITDASTAVQSTCELFISSIFANRRSGNYDFTAFTSADAAVDNTIAYVISSNQYKQEVSELFGYEIVSDSISFDGFTATVEGDTCEAEIAVHYSYDITGRFDETCYQNCVYYLTLEKEDNRWSIKTVKTSLPQEQEEGFIYGAFDVQAAIQAVSSFEQDVESIC